MTDTRALDRRGVLLITGSLLALGLVAGLVAWGEIHTPTLDPVTLCAVGKPISGEVAILLDVTDPLSQKQQAAVMEWLRELELTDLLPNERVSLWVLGAGQGGVLDRTFSRCYPGRESDRLFHNPAASAARCDSLFARPLREAVERAAGGQHFPRSPILEAIREITSQAEFADPAGRRHLVVASDLEQNTSVLNFYRTVPSFAAFQRSPRFPPLRADLHGVAVDVLYLPRGDDAAWLSPQLEDFWQGYLTACGASPVRIRRL